VNQTSDFGTNRSFIVWGGHGAAELPVAENSVNIAERPRQATRRRLLRRRQWSNVPRGGKQHGRHDYQLCATLTVNAAAVTPTITTQRVNQTVIRDKPRALVLWRRHGPLSYQWQRIGERCGSDRSELHDAVTTTRTVERVPRGGKQHGRHGDDAAAS